MINKIDVINDSVFLKTDGIYILNLKLSNKILDVFIEKNINISLLIKGRMKTISLNIVQNENSTALISLLNKNPDINLEIKGEVSENATLNIALADFNLSGNSLCNSTINLVKKNAKSNFYLSSVATLENKKNYYINFNNLEESTQSNIEAFGVSLKSSEINIKGISYIKKGAVKSVANQSVRVILFDEKSRGSASPSLKIDCDDIKANHSCSIGSINEDHLYYLLSRGLDLESVRKLIVTGYIIPIKNYFPKSEKKYIDNFIEEEFKNV